MPDFTASDGVRLAYLVEGDLAASRPPVVLLHGGGASAWLNWVVTGWAAVLNREGYGVVAPDARGHGQSEAPTAAEAYAPRRTALDVAELIDHLGLDRPHVHGYSMGGATALRLALDHPHRLRSVVVGGMGPGPKDEAERAMLRARMESGTFDLLTPREREIFGDAFAAAMPMPRHDPVFTALREAALSGPSLFEELPSISVPLLAVHGEDDPIALNADAFETLVPGGRRVVVAGAGHVMAIMSEEYQRAVLDFLAEQH